MNKELKDHIDAMDDDEKYSYSLTLRFSERVIDFFGISILFIAIIMQSIFLGVIGGAIVIFLAIVGSTIKGARIYIEEKLRLR
jgi:uncharacterized RDD family membrane protein YckC